MRVWHLITGLDTGGAEVMLYKLLSRLDPAVHRATVISLTDTGVIGDRIRQLGIGVEALGMRKGPSLVTATLRLSRRIRAERPDVLQTWLYHADLVGGVAARVAGGCPVIWNVRQSNLSLRLNKPGTLALARLGAVLAYRLCEAVVCCSRSAMDAHRDLGYPEVRLRVIPNGFDLESFRSDAAARASVRAELGLPQEAMLIGRIGRLDPQKDHATFLRAFAALAREQPGLHAVMAGEGVVPGARGLASLIREHGLGPRVHLLGRRDDVPRITASLDVAVSSSRGEGFPNVVGEAMACAVPCVVTDVGDCAWMVGETGVVVPPGEPGALARGCARLLSMPPGERARLGEAARERIATHFSIESVAATYQKLYEEITDGVRNRGLR